MEVWHFQNMKIRSFLERNAYGAGGESTRHAGHIRAARASLFVLYWNILLEFALRDTNKGPMWLRDDYCCPLTWIREVKEMMTERKWCQSHTGLINTPSLVLP